MIHIYTGDGKGKTTAAAGMAARMAGHGGKVLFAQFLKGSPTGETVSLERLNVTVLRCDRDYGFFNSMTDADKSAITKCHNDNLRYISEHMSEYDMIVLDEIFAALALGLADSKAVQKIADTYSGELVMTGRDAPKEYIEKADYVSEIMKIKHPYDKGTAAREGVEF